jgi:hypothetical protein
LFEGGDVLVVGWFVFGVCVWRIPYLKKCMRMGSDMGVGKYVDI